jgi:hypothetical protein
LEKLNRRDLPFAVLSQENCFKVWRHTDGTMDIQEIV